jgi:hypothetical protein
VTTAGPVIRWAAGPFAFSLETDDAPVRTLAASVFRPWMDHDERAHRRTWQVDQATGDGERPAWRVRSSAGMDVEVPSPARAVSVVEYNAVAAIAESEAVIVHGALVVRDGRGLLITGRGEAGKSTLACALWDRGATLLGDDMAILDVATGVARPAPRRVSVRMPSRAILGDAFFERIMAGPSSVATPESYLFHPEEIEPRPRFAEVPLHAIVLLARRGGVTGPARYAPIAPAHALLAFLPYTNQRSRGPLGAVIQKLAPLANRVPVFDLGRGPLDGMAAAVEQLADQGVPA